MANGYNFGMSGSRTPTRRQYQSPNRRLAEILLQQQAKQPYRGGTRGQIANFIQSGLGAYLMSKDARQQQSAQDAFIKSAESGDMKALKEMSDNPYAKNRLQNLLMRQMSDTRKAGIKAKELKSAKDLYRFQQQEKTFPPQRLRPGVDVAFSPEVQSQKLAQQTAGRTTWGIDPTQSEMMVSSTGERKAVPQTPIQKAQTTIDLEAAQTQAEAKKAFPGLEQKARSAISNVESLMSHPGLSGVVGMPESISGFAYKLFDKAMPATDEADFTARLEQLGGQQFLQAFESLKGGGAISEVEGKKASAAISRLMNTGQSEESYRKAGEEVIGIYNRALDTARKAGGIQPNVSQSGEDVIRVQSTQQALELPPGTVFITPDGRRKVR